MVVDVALGEGGLGDADRQRLGVSAEALRVEYAFLVKAGLDAALIEACCAEAVARGTAPHLLLMSKGLLTPHLYLRLLEREIRPQRVRHNGHITEIVDGLAGHPSQIAETVAAIEARGHIPLLLSHQHLSSPEPSRRSISVDQAANGLLRRQPELSAGSPYALWQLIAFPVALGLSIGGLAVAPLLTLATLATLATLVFVVVVGLRATLFLTALTLPRFDKASAVLPDETLPVYSVLVPLFQEADVARELIAALQRLDYPVDRLDILLILEAEDETTRAALAALHLPAQFRIVVVPDHPPRTKPKALNFALSLCRGEYVVIYDAEDVPEPDQLRRAVAGFRSGPPNLICQQARLVPDNRKPRWLARQFTLEYAAQFDAILPALARLRLPIPLGGTSNHFPRSALEKIGGWDSWNVTEDADLGTRVARRGGAVAILASDTFEEAPERFSVWLRQRTRWLKGFMQTWAVHMRRPYRLLRELGVVGFLAFNALIGGLVLSALVHPIFVGYLIWEGWQGTLLTWPDTWFGDVVFAAALLNLGAGYLAGMATAAVAALRRGNGALLLEVPLIPFYWMVISVAAYRALWQFIVDPHLWEKTPHRARADRGSRRPAR